MRSPFQQTLKQITTIEIQQLQTQRNIQIYDSWCIVFWGLLSLIMKERITTQFEASLFTPMHFKIDKLNHKIFYNPES